MRLLVILGDEPEFGEQCEVVGGTRQEVVPRVARLGGALGIGDRPRGLRDGVHRIPEVLDSRRCGRHHNGVGHGLVDRGGDRCQALDELQICRRCRDSTAGVPGPQSAQELGVLRGAVLDVDAHRHLVEGVLPQRARRSSNPLGGGFTDPVEPLQAVFVREHGLDVGDAVVGERSNADLVAARLSASIRSVSFVRTALPASRAALRSFASSDAARWMMATALGSFANVDAGSIAAFLP